MASSGGDAAPPPNGGQFLLQLLQKPPQNSTPPPPPPTSVASSLDPAISFFSHSQWSHPSPPPPPTPPQHHHQHQHQHLPFAPHVFFPSSSPPGFTQLLNHPLNPNPSPPNQLPHILHNHHDHKDLIFQGSGPESRNFGGFLNGGVKESGNQVGDGNHKDLLFGGVGAGSGSFGGFLNEGVKVSGGSQVGDGNRNRKDLVFGGVGAESGNFGGFLNGGVKESGSQVGGLRGSVDGNRNLRGSGGSGRAVAPPPGFVNKSGGGGNRDRWGSQQDLEKGRGGFGEVNRRENDSNGKEWSYNGRNEGGLSSQFQVRGPQSGSRVGSSVSTNDFEESLMTLRGEEGQGRDRLGGGSQQKMKESGNGSQSNLDDVEDQLASSLQIDEGSEGINSKEKRKGSRDKDYRSDKRGQWILGQRMRIMKRQSLCRRDIDRLNAPFLEIYKLLIPPEEEKQKQEKLLTLLGSLVKKEWPEAQLHVYGSCANSFGFSKSDIDICLVIRSIEVNKSEILLKLAEELESNNFQNVQALTRARVPIVKLMDPNTGISCDICINNILAVINTKLLHDYSRIDGRLRQLAFIVKHWAKRRGVNETYQGTLSSYAYVLMCINFLQQRKPAILPCLQGMEPTYSVTVENRECAYFNEVDKLYGFGGRNGETIAQLVWAFFTYWAYCHDYTNDVISVRTGLTLSKHVKDWTRRIGNDRHLICIEDPFETSHDLGRVVDKASIRVLREEFERAAEIMQHDSDPCTKLFEPYVPT